ncbi:hypothetical protein [Okeania sp. SIO1I7]|uniref:hypothetical protein n=1 Tax=Okeania sp. SIO1I7 TaxID=2607772 RepID=UPI0013FC1CC6|nr:hypothetical protein [Okeania sp. SIO1I7]NET24709.1 hypothetical protein [Okeania sp. SIO1I7]
MTIIGKEEGRRKKEEGRRKREGIIFGRKKEQAIRKSEEGKKNQPLFPSISLSFLFAQELKFMKEKRKNEPIVQVYLYHLSKTFLHFVE